jgi:hypothetical protein
MKQIEEVLENFGLWLTKFSPNLAYPVYFCFMLIRMFPLKEFDQKISYKMLFDRRRFLYQTADKFEAKKFALSVLGQSAVAQLYAVYNNAFEINWAELPEEFVIKVTHGSGGSLVVCNAGKNYTMYLNSDGEFPLEWNVMRVSPKDLRYEVVERYFNQMLKKTYGWGDPFPFHYEWLYKKIKPRIIIEEYLSVEGNSPIDYRLFVMDRKVRYIQRDEITLSNHFSTLHNTDWGIVPVKYNYEMTTKQPIAPLNLKKMIEYSELLAEGTDFARVDFYEIGKRLIFGEITHYPRGGRNTFEPREFSQVFAEKWKPPIKYRDRGKLTQA